MDQLTRRIQDRDINLPENPGNRGGSVAVGMPPQSFRDSMLGNFCGGIEIPLE